MTWRNVAVTTIGLIVGGWMSFDGTRALIVGDYVTPSTGPHAGQLGPWSRVVGAVGIEPRSTFVRAMHIASGLLWLGPVALLVGGRPVVRRKATAAAAIGGLWYLPFGTLAGVVVLLLIFTEGHRSTRETELLSGDRMEN